MVIEKSKYIIASNCTVIEALSILNNLSDDVLTLFVVDSNDVLLGTLTDGDIRRSLVNGIKLSDSVSNIVKFDFWWVKEGGLIVEEIRDLKNKGVNLLPALNNLGKIQKIYNLQKYKSILPIDVVLMAGGKGERLRPLTETTPKPLLKIGDKAIIDYNIDRLLDYGIDRINVTINYLGDQLIKHFETPINGVQIQCVKEPKYLGTMGSVSFVETFKNDTVLVMNSDLFTNIDYEDFFLHFMKNDADMSVAAVPYTVNVPYGIFDLEENNIKGINEKPSYNYYANAGIYMIKRRVLDMIPEDEFFNATDLIDLLIKENKKIVRFPLVGYWIDIGKPIDFQKAQDFVKHL